VQRGRLFGMEPDGDPVGGEPVMARDMKGRMFKGVMMPIVDSFICRRGITIRKWEDS
jgi:hypothetical protein